MKDNYTVFSNNSIKKFKLEDWDSCNKNGNVFLSYNFLCLLEDSKSITIESGWEPIYFGLKKNNLLVAVVPCYIKYHSQGEFVFDHAWAQAYQRLGMNYYPKLLIASPFTPVSGKRLLTIQEDDLFIKKKLMQSIKQFCNDKNISSIHINFCEESELPFLKEQGFLIRYGEQFHFINEKYKNFKHFLGHLSYKIEKYIKREIS